MLKFSLQKDYDAYQSKLDAMRKRKSKRKCNLLNSKRRVIGIDVQAVNEQISQKQNQKLEQDELRQRLDNTQNEYIMNQILIHNSLKCRVQQERQRETCNMLAKQVCEKMARDKSNRDIYHEYNCSKEQNFLIDENLKELKLLAKQKKYQQRCVLDEQIREREARLKKYRKEEETYNQKQRASHKIYEQQDALLLEEQYNRNDAVKVANDFLVKENRERDAKLRANESELEKADIKQHQDSGLLTEIHLHSTTRTNFKGWTETQHNNMRIKRSKQIEEKKQLAKNENKLHQLYIESQIKNWKAVDHLLYKCAEAQRSQALSNKHQNECLARQNSLCRSRAQAKLKMRLPIHWPFGRDDR